MKGDRSDLLMTNSQRSLSRVVALIKEAGQGSA